MKFIYLSEGKDENFQKVHQILSGDDNLVSAIPGGKFEDKMYIVIDNSQIKKVEDVKDIPEPYLSLCHLEDRVRKQEKIIENFRKKKTETSKMPRIHFRCANGKVSDKINGYHWAEWNNVVSKANSDSVFKISSNKLFVNILEDGLYHIRAKLTSTVNFPGGGLFVFGIKLGEGHGGWVDLSYNKKASGNHGCISGICSLDVELKEGDVVGVCFTGEGPVGVNPGNGGGDNMFQIKQLESYKKE